MRPAYVRVLTAPDHWLINCLVFDELTIYLCQLTSRMPPWMQEDLKRTRVSNSRTDKRSILPLHIGIRGHCPHPRGSRASRVGAMQSFGYSLLIVGCEEAVRTNALGLEDMCGSDEL